MLDIVGRRSAATDHFPPPEFLHIALSQSREGTIFASITATLVDPDEPELVGLDVASDTIASVDELAELIRAHIKIGAPAMPRFRNFYRCARCGHEWSDVWSATCDDDCPKCGARHMSPYRSEDDNNE